MGNDFCCEALFEMTPKKQMVRLKVRKCYYTDEIKSQKHGFTNEFEPVLFQKQIQKKENMNYQRIHMSKHDFGKVNLITTKKGDEYKCNDCGCNGFRDGLSSYILIKKNKDMSFCAKAKKEIVLPKKITLISIQAANDFGLAVNSIYDVIPSPTEQYKTDVWVFSPKRNEPIRLLDSEYLGYEGNRTVTDASTTVTDEPLATTTPKGLIKYKSHEYQDGALLDYVHGIKAENGSFFTLCGIDADGGGSAFETEPLPNNAKIDCPFCKDEFEKSKIELITQEKWFSQDEPTVTITDEPLATAKNDLVDELITDIFKRRDLDNLGKIKDAPKDVKTILETMTFNEPIENATIETVTDTTALKTPKQGKKNESNDAQKSVVQKAILDTLKKVAISTKSIAEKCEMSTTEISSIKSGARFISIEKALDMCVVLGEAEYFMIRLVEYLKNRVKDKTGKQVTFNRKQLELF